MVSQKTFICKQCNKKFILGSNRCCPKCRSFNIKPNDNPENLTLVKKSENKNSNSIDKKKIIRNNIKLKRPYLHKSIFAAWTLIWIGGIIILNDIFGSIFEFLVFVWPFMVMMFLIPVAIYQSRVK